MKNKRFTIICSILVVITTICLCINFILNNKDTTITLKELNRQIYKHEMNDALSESTETIEFNETKAIKTITVKAKDNETNDTRTVSSYDYYIKDNIIYIKFSNNIVNSFRYENKCIIDTENSEIKYCN